MKNTILVTALLSLFTSCAMKPVSQNVPYDTNIGFEILPPPNGPWYEIKTPDGTGYVLGREKSEQDKKDGTTVISEVRFGFINRQALKLNSNKETLQLFEKDMSDKSNTDRFENMKNQFKQVRFKDADCMSFEQVGTDKVISSFGKMRMSYKGLLCLHPQDPSRYIKMGLSQRVPVDKSLTDFQKDEAIFYNGLVFNKLKNY